VTVKTQVVLPKKKETPGTVVYAVPNPSRVVVGQVYVRKHHLKKIGNGDWPAEIKLTIEPGNTTGEQA
jgi:ribosomal protein L24